MGYPSAVASFTTKNAGDVIQPSHVNDPQTEITAIESGLLNGLSHKLVLNAGLQSSNSTFTGTVVISGTLDLSGASVNSSNSTVANLSVTGVATANAQPRCHVYRDTTQNIENNTETALSFNAQEFNVGSMHSTGTNPTRITFKETGLFLVGATVSFPANGTGNRYLRFEKTSGGSTSSLGSRESAPPDGSLFGAVDPSVFSKVVPVSVSSTGDYVQVLVLQTSGSSLAVGSATRNLACEAWTQKIW